MKKTLSLLGALVAMLVLPTTMGAANAPDDELNPSGEYSPGDFETIDHVFKLVKSKEDITDDGRYLVASLTEDGCYVMVPSHHNTNSHKAISAELLKGEFLVYAYNDFGKSSEDNNKPLLLRGRGNADEMHLFFEFDRRFQLYGYGNNTYDRPGSDYSKRLPLAKSSCSQYGWQFSFDAKNEWTNEWGWDNIKSETTTGMYMRMPTDDKTYYGKTLYTYVEGGWENLRGVEYPSENCHVVLFKEICTHHDYEVGYVEAIAPTCVAPGYSGVYYCAGCNKYYNDAACTQPTTLAEHVVPALGHQWNGDECSHCHQTACKREFNRQKDNAEGFVYVAEMNGKYYAMGLNPVEEGMEAIEVDMDEDEFFKADITKLACMKHQGFNLGFDPNAALRVYQNKLQPMYYDTEGNCFYDGIRNVYTGDGYENNFMEDINQTWDDDSYDWINNNAVLSGTNNVDGKSYKAVLKLTDGGVPYFGLQLYDNNITPEDGYVFYIQCTHSNLLHTPGEAARCLEPSTMESYYCPDCERYFADAICHHEVDVDDYQPTAATGHHYENGSTVCSYCGEGAGVYRPVTDTDQFNAGYYYMMVGHIGGQYYALTRPTLQVYNPWGEEISEEDMEYYPKKFMWDNKKLQATPVTLNADGSITANHDNLLEFSLCTNRGNYSETDYMAGSPYVMRTPWGMIMESQWDPVVADFEQCKFLNWKYVEFAPETIYRRFRFPTPGYTFFNEIEDENEIPANIRNITIGEKSILMHCSWAYTLEDDGTYILAKENGEVYFAPLNTYWSQWGDYEHPTAELMVPTLYYCASKPMPHLNVETAEMAIYGDELTEEGFEKALDEVTEEEDVRIFNIDLSNVTNINVTGENMRDKVFENEAVSNNAFIIVPNESTLSGTNIIRNGQCDDVVITDGDPFVVPEQFTADDNLLQSAHASYERAMGGSSVWGTLYLPFVIKSNADVQLFKLAEVTVDGDEGVLTFEPVDEVAESTPCVFRRNTAEGGVSFDVNNVAIHPAGASLSTDVENWNMLGTFDGCNIQSYQHLVNDDGYEYYDDDDITRYYIASNQFWQSEIQTWVPPFRAWFEQKSVANAAKKLRIFVVEDDVTSILEIDDRGNLNQMPKDAIYDLRGNRVMKAEHGVFIINGKKVAVK